jgi:hypothetical protein
MCTSMGRAALDMVAGSRASPGGVPRRMRKPLARAHCGEAVSDE